MIITIDTGTTNTRVTLFKKDQFIDQVKSSVGVRNTSIDGHNKQLTSTVTDAINELKTRHNITNSDIKAILAAGMITSNLGLHEVNHLVAPVALDDFTQHIQSLVIPEISPLPIHFIPGVKNKDTNEIKDIIGLDIMRGEEVEAMAIAHLFNIEEDAIIALPGSHSKFVAIDSQKSIKGCCTTLTGELNAIITHNTILTSSLENRFSDTLCRNSLIDGYEKAEYYGLGHTLFLIRLQEQFLSYSHHQLASFLIGALLHSDIKALCHLPQLNFTNKTPVYIGGSGLLCDALTILLKHLFPQNRIQSCEEIQNLSAIGSIYIAQKAQLISL